MLFFFLQVLAVVFIKTSKSGWSFMCSETNKSFFSAASLPVPILIGLKQYDETLFLGLENKSVFVTRAYHTVRGGCMHGFLFVFA